MLSFINVASPNEIKNYIEQFDPQKTTWIVSDLKSKLDIQNKCLAKQGYFLDESILRISDFWRLWLRRLAPDISVVSADFIKVLVQNFMQTDQMKSLQSDLQLESHQFSTIYKYLNELAPIILSPQSDIVMQDWAKEKNKTWYKWYLVCQLCMNYLVQEKKVIDSQWIPSYLQNVEQNLIQWSHPIYLDLGSEMTSVEMGLFQRLSQSIDVKVFVPSPTWKDKYKFLLNTYLTHQGYGKSQDANAPSLASSSSKSFKRFGTEALEIKFIIHQTRQWIESGIQPERIGWVSPRVEEYWPILKIHLDAEGIPYNKKHVTTLIGLGCFQSLLSKLYSSSTVVSWESLEQSYYDEQDKSLIEYEKFKSQFLELTDVEDLSRIDEIKKIFFNKINLKEKLSRIQFLALIYKHWSMNYYEASEADVKLNSYLEIAFKDFFSSTTDTELQLEHWLTLFQTVLSKKEILLQKANSAGIDIGSSQSNHLYDVECMIWFGLDDSGFRKNSQSMIPLSDIEELKYNFDFPLNYPEESHTEFNIQWLSQYNYKQQIFTCSQFSSKAEPLNTSTLILEQAPQPDVEFDLNQYSTCVDINQIQQANLSLSSLPQKIQDELIDHEITVTAFKPTQLSMTDFTNYDHCGFKLLAAKGFKLKDYPVASLDLDPRQRGSIAHALFEYLVTDKKYKKFDQSAVDQFLDQKRTEFKLYVQLDDFWSAQKKKLLDTAQRFCQFENDRLGKLQVDHFVEKAFSLQFNKMQITGRIDRVDVYTGHFALIYDYKRSDNSSTSYGHSWIEKKEFQMLFYITAIEKAFSIETGMKDAGAFYFFYKNMSVYKGVLNQEAADKPEIASSVTYKKDAIQDTKEYHDLKSQFIEHVLLVEDKISSGLFSAKPFKKDICDKCEWNTLCRAAHL